MKSKTVILIWILLLLAGAFLYGFSLSDYRKKNELYRQFFKKWQLQNLKHYVLEYESRDCYIKINVQNAKPRIIKKQGCYLMPPWVQEKPMQSLFNILLKYSKESRCGANGCLCSGMLYSEIHFDKQLGYIKSWKEHPIRYFTPYFTSGPPIQLACGGMFYEPYDFKITVSALP